MGFPEHVDIILKWIQLNRTGEDECPSPEWLYSEMGSSVRHVSV